MTLAETLAQKLDSSSLETGLFAALAGAQTALAPENLSLPAGLSGLGAVAAQAAAVDPAAAGAALKAAEKAIAALVAQLPGAAATLAAISGPLAIVEAATTQPTPIADQIRTLLDRLEAEIAAPGGSGFAGRLARLVAALGEAKEGQALGKLLAGWLAAGGIDPRAAGLPPADFTAGFQGAVDALGGLMSLESVLAEGERLAGLLADRLDPAAVERRLADISAALAAAGTPADLPAVRARIDEMGSAVAEDMGFGEATLLYLDLPRLQVEATRAAATVDAADTAAIARTLAALAERLLNLGGIAIEGVAERRFDQLLDDLEARSTQLAQAIDQADSSFLIAPITAAVARLRALDGELAAAISRVVVAARADLEEVRDAVAALPVAAIADAVTRLLAPVREALAAARALVAAVQAEIGAAAARAADAVAQAKAALDTALAAFETLFATAAGYVDSLHLDEVIGKVEDDVRRFADDVAAFQMKPYVDAAVTAIEDAAAVIEKVPFDLLPPSMDDEVAALVTKIKKVHPKEDLKRPDWNAIEKALTCAVKDVRNRYDGLIKTVRDHDPRALATRLDGALAQLAGRIRQVSPQATLEPVTRAVKALSSAVASVDFAAQLGRLQTAFDAVVKRVDDYSPAALVEPLAQRVDGARTRLLAELRLDDWPAALDDLAQRAASFLARLDPARAEEEIAAAWDEAGRLLEALPGLLPAGGFGAVIAACLTGTGLGVQPLAFEVVVRWIGGGGAGGGATLAGHAGRLAQAIARARAAVAAVDPQDMLARLDAGIQQVRTVLAATPDGQAAVGDLEAAAQRALGSLVNNRKRYLAALVAAVAAADGLGQASFATADSAVLRLRVAVDPLRVLWQVVLDLLARAGVHGLEQGLTGLLRGLLDAAPPERVARILAPILTAVHARVSAAVEGAPQALADGIQELKALIGRIDLAPLRDALGAVHLEIGAQVAALSPQALLGAVASDLAALQADLAADPLAGLGVLGGSLATLRDGAADLLTEIDADDLLAKPIASWDKILAAFGALDLAALLAPLEESLAGLREEAETGFDRAIAAYERLQEALPAA
jgi:hypothetical protein